MKVGVFAVYDSAAECYQQPMYALTPGIAERWFTERANDQADPLCKHAQDFTLFRLGEWDDKTGAFIQEETPVPLCGAWTVKKESV